GQGAPVQPGADVELLRQVLGRAAGIPPRQAAQAPGDLDRGARGETVDGGLGLRLQRHVATGRGRMPDGIGVAEQDLPGIRLHQPTTWETSVLLPAPLWPSSPTISAAETRREMSSLASTAP